MRGMTINNMHEIKCPKCGTTFQIDEDNFESILKQVRNHEFDEEMKRIENQYKLDKENALKLSESEIEKKYLEEENKLKLEIVELKNKLDINNKEKESEIKEVTLNIEKKYSDEINRLKTDINNLNSNLKIKDTENKLAIEKAVSERDKNIGELQNKLLLNSKEYELKEKTIKDSYNDKIKQKDEIIEYYKDLKTSLSTKMVGETLEQHCNIEFNRLRPLFPKAYFEKDNDAKTGSKGDFIYRDYDEDGIEIVSIMFEMKNENDETSTKHKNEDFFKELDKDRKEKNCEYAVLVSLLEKDNDFYNSGITDVSHKYEKMYVIRPQSFISIITLLRSANLNALQYKKQFLELRNTNIDISNFEENMNKFKDSFSKNYQLASSKFNKAIEDIDKTIAMLNRTKEELLSSDRNLRLANDKANDLTIKKIVKNNKTMARKFADISDDPELKKLADKLENKKVDD